MLIAITRKVSRAIVDCELTHLARVPIDVERTRLQHSQYESVLSQLGLAVLSLPKVPTLADSVFVEDTALVLDECAVILRPGADSRLPEIPSIAKALLPYRRLFQVEAPARVDGGDLLRVGRRIYLGISTRSDLQALEQLQHFLQPFGYVVQAIPVTGCLHLKSAVTEIAEDTLLINPAWVDRAAFNGVKFVETDASEPYAANALRFGATVIYPNAYSRTLQRLRSSGIRVIPVEAEELAKAEGGVTCCSLIFQA